MSAFGWPARVYWEDTDAGGIVYYANYLKYLERARTEWLRALGFSQQQLARDTGIGFTVVSLSIEYKRPARLDDELLVTCEPRSEGAASLSFGQRILRAGAAAGAATHTVSHPDSDSLLVTADVRVACVDVGTLRPQRLPQILLSALAARESA